MKKERVVIPPTEKGMRCVEVLASIAMKRIEQAREAVTEFIDNLFPVVEILEESAMRGGKYTAVYSIKGGERQKVVYDYRTKAIELI